jgi:xanthine dehydrogenase accessory factor
VTFGLTYLRHCAERGPFARVLVTRAAGSVPRGAGTSMVVWQDGQDGTIGGGRLEWDAVRDARAMIGRGGICERTYPLGPELGQCCGGSVTLVTEVFDAHSLPSSLPYARPLRPASSLPSKIANRLATMPPQLVPLIIDGWLIETAHVETRHLWIWGAGHVGRALVNVLAPLPDLSITWVDIARDRFPDNIPEGVTEVIAADPPLLAAHAPKSAEHIILTHSHQIDLDLCHALLSRGFSALGLIGSATKWARFRNRLTSLGHSPAQISRIACPIGDPTLGKHPQAIALGVATRLLARADSDQDKETGTT